MAERTERAVGEVTTCLVVKARGFFFPDEDERAALRRLLLASAAVSLLLLAVLPIRFVPDSSGYYQFAQVLLGRDVAAPTYRTPGYPLLLVISGLFAFGSLYGLLVLQAVMAALIPLLVYRIMLPAVGHFRSLAAAWICLASLVPAMYLKSVYTEQFYLFLEFTACWLASGYIYRKRPMLLYGTALALLVLMLVKPSSNLLFVPWLAVLLLAAPRKWPHILVGVAIIMGGNALWTHQHNRMFSSEASVSDSEDWLGYILLMNVYLERIPLRESNGPATKRFIGSLRAHFAEKLGDSQVPPDLTITSDFSLDDFFFGRFLGSPDKLVDRLLDKPAFAHYMYFLSRASPAEVLGGADADRLMLDVYLEALAAHPMQTVKMYIEHLLIFCLGPPKSYIYSYDPQFVSYWEMPRFTGRPTTIGPLEESLLPRRALAELRFDPVGSTPLAALRDIVDLVWGRLYLSLRPLLFLGMLAGLWILRRSPHRNLALLLGITVLYQWLLVSITNLPAQRYISQTLLFEVLVILLAFDGRGLGQLFIAADRNSDGNLSGSGS